MASASQVVTYGLESSEGEDWLKQVLKSPAPQFTLELKGFGRGGTEELGGISKEAHAKNILGGWYPWVWQTWNDWMEMILWAWCNYEEVGSTGSMSSGKSRTFSLLAWLEWSAAPMHSACVISSTTRDAIRTRIWGHIKKFRSGLVVNGQVATFPSHLVDSRTTIQAEKGDDMHSITSVAVQGGQLEIAIGNLQGRHPARNIIFVDEGEQTPDAIFSARFNLRGGTQLYRFISSANAVNPASAYGQFIEPKAGWNSVKASDQFWDTKTGICLHFDGLESPNVKAGKVVVPGLIQREDIEAIRAAKGEDSLEWWMYVRGFPCFGGARNTVLNWSHIIANKADKSAIWQGLFRWILALDPAFTSGGDKCVLRFARVGFRDDGKQTLGLEPPILIKLVSGTGVPEEYQIADRIKEEVQAIEVKWNVVIPGSDFAMDSTAATALAAIIEQRWKPGIRRINYGSAPTERKMPGDDKTARQRCKNRVAEMWFSFAALVRAGQVRGLDPAAAEQFCTRQYTLEGEKYILESKPDMKERTGGKSPDEADCTVELGDLFRDIAGIEQPTSNGVSRAEEWEKTARRFNLRETYA